MRCSPRHQRRNRKSQRQSQYHCLLHQRRYLRPPVVQIPITTPPPQPAPEPLPERIEVTASSGADLEFKLPEQFQDLPFQDMTLADIDEAVRSQPVFEHSGFQPLNVLPEPAPQPQPTTAAPTRQPASRSTYFPTTRPQAVGMPTRPSQ